MAHSLSYMTPVTLVLSLLLISSISAESEPICDLPKDPGPCRAYFQKYFFNNQTGECESFIYGGCRGNLNNFDTLELCEADCKPGTVDVCSLPLKVGPCEAATPRYFYNSTSERCERFLWGGCQPNENNFLNQKACEDTCEPSPVDVCKLPKKIGPCRAAIPRYHFNSETEQCELFSWGGCQPNGNNFLTQQACEDRCEPASVDVCTLPKKVGPCRAAIPRYHFNSVTGQCEQFSWGGCQPNGNNFLTQQACEDRCEPVSVDVCTLPKKVGPCKAAISKYYFNSQSGQCERFTWGGCQPNGNNFETLSECQAECPSLDTCELPADPGPCEAFIPRYFFNSTSEKCEKFIYGGCQGNSNNFKTLLECKQRCDEDSLNQCEKPLDIGPCDGICPRWGFSNGECSEFSYGCCGGNSNNFRTQAACEKTCEPAPVDVCSLPKKVGPCKAARRRYYFNSNVGRCMRFIWGGCRPNENNFRSLRECRQACPNTYTRPTRPTRSCHGRWWCLRSL